jgi:hypothetical protein
MSPVDSDRSVWTEARARGRREFIERRVTGVGLRLGAALAAWNTAIGGTYCDYDHTRLLLEAAFYVLASMVCCALSALIEWKYLERRFGSLALRDAQRDSWTAER